ncbi:trafficking protein Mon1-domain-containing protein [Crassisporium funariophilum]|nr:trafficking protein Mon1-domain-containing protein [Crassisporium funariophilum]
MDPAEGILIQDIDADVGHTDAEDIETLDKSVLPVQSDGPKKLLRDQLRKTLSHRAAQSESSRYRHEEKQPDVSNEYRHDISAIRYPPREYYVLTDAGKPVFISRPGGAEQDDMASTIGIMQALISVFLDDGDKIRSINAGRTRITFLLRPPLYYVCASSWGEPESVTRAHLEYLHLQILSIVSGAQLKRIFERRTNFDLRRLLNGKSLGHLSAQRSFMTSMLWRLESDMAMTMSSLNCLKLEPNLRKRIAESLVPVSKLKDMLYIIVIANNRVVTLIRPRKHSIHPADLHIIMNTIHSPSIFNSPASASWIPVCLPKFNPAGFVNAYITFLRKDDSVNLQDTSTSTSHDGQSLPQSVEGAPTEEISKAVPQEGLNESGITFVCISGGGEFDVIRGWCDSVIKKLTSEGTLTALLNAYQSKQTEYSVSELGIPGLRHFVYKSRTQVQITLPTFEDPYDDTQARKRIMTLYQTLHDSIHAKSGQDAGLKLQYIRTDSESVMGWITQPFELYIALSPLLPKSAAVGAANAVARWVKKEEARLFLRDAPVF